MCLQYPERIYTTAFGATALDFSVAHPNLLAVRFFFFRLFHKFVNAIKNSQKRQQTSRIAWGDNSKAFVISFQAGLYDGTVAIYNVRNTTNETVLDSL